ncbi:hypothetical protein NA56DRAFT_656564 [Hyaloscypha hepaticicola]|uniref:Heterokaryon incompatibility domain-containing protein n=1 Tax=Hyaloscypha hepaticicola TaxID=2082293 RepID=A0A2J6QCX0_9HELO|nr:hypothetical protein NA56DRAFT_656564 [Hyaloscypha hepaticicola]
MSFGFSISDFLAVIELTNKIRKEFISAPSQFKNISDEVRSLSIVIHDVDIVLSECEPDGKQKTELQEIASSCHKILNDLEKTLDNYDELQTYSGNIDNRVKRVWKKLKWEPQDIQEIRNRITSNVTLLNTCIARISGQAAYTEKMGVDRLNERQDDQERLGILDWLTPITTSRYNYFFQTPEMTSFKYKPIGLEGPAFRLLRLLKGDDDLIQGQLFDSKLPPPASPEYVRDYAALSYTWGSQSRPCEIMINGSILTVTKNAYLALRDLRYQEKDRILWIDALCINQNDDKERGEQVQQMGYIYSKAERVIIWLGEATYNTDYVMHYMKQLEKEGTKHASNDQKISDKQWVDIWSAVVHSLSADQRDLLVEGLRSLLRRNWFKRVWIIQEVANARVAEITCGGKSVSSSIFVLTLSLLEITPDPHCQPILDIMPGPLRNSSWWAKKRDLRTLLVKFCKSEATDQRDSIYALLGISSDTCDSDFLKSAMYLGHEVLVQLLIVRDDVDINIKVSGQTPLSWAAREGHEAAVKLLLERSAEMETKDNNYGQTPLSLAAEKGHEAVVKLLLERGAELETKSNNSRSPLSWAARRGHKAIVKLLLEKGAQDYNNS